jgi:MFS family permease
MTKSLFATAVVARLPLATFSLGTLVHVQHLTGSYAQAGVAVGATAIAQAAGGPALGRMADRHGRTRVLLGSTVVATAALTGLALAPAGTALELLVALAALLGLSVPPVGACLRALIPALFPADERRMYAVDTAATELTWAAGPPLAMLIGACWGSGAALLAAGAVLLVATTVFAVSSPAPAGPANRSAARSALVSPALRTLVLVLVGVGVVFGATEVAVTATAGAAAAGPLIGLWGVGSLAGGVITAKLGGGATGGRGFAVLLTLLGLGHAALGGATGSLLALGVMITLAGSLIAPILASAYAMAEQAAPAGTTTEAFAWLATASAIGTSAGAAAAGALADTAGPAAAFLLAGLAGLAAAVIALPVRIPATA